jgi:hypothetical protein
MSKKASLELSAANRAVQVGVVQQRKPLLCPVQGCSKLVARVDLHLRSIHKLNKDDPEYIRLAKYFLSFFLTAI